MLKFFLAALVLLVCPSLVIAQADRVVLTFVSEDFHRDLVPEGVRSTDEMGLPLPVGDPFLTMAIVSDVPGSEQYLEVVFRTADGLSSTFPFRPDPHAGTLSGATVGRLDFLWPTDGPFVSFRVQWTGPDAPPPGGMRLHFYHPGPTRRGAPQAADSSAPLSLGSACPCPEPDYENRLDWCPAGNCPPDPTPVPTQVGFLVIHHSAGTNNASDWAAVVRAIWDFHVNVNGWDDIGYNWLVDPNGMLYEGRGDNRLGAHFCGANGGTMGVCMLGDFTSVQPTTAARNTLTELLSWKACDASLDPLGSAYHPGSGLTLSRIAGHQDGCATACPGNQFYPTLPALRQSVADRIAAGCPSMQVSAPSLLTGTLVAADQAELLWVDNSDNESDFVLERAVGPVDTFAILAVLPPNTVGYYDLGLPAGNTLRYRVKAVSGGVDSDYSNEVVLMTLTGLSPETGGKGAGAGLRVVPNPAGETVRLHARGLSGDGRVDVFDLSGKLVACWPAVHFQEGVSETLPAAMLPGGHYRVRLSQGEKVLSAGFLKQ